MRTRLSRRIQLPKAEAKVPLPQAAHPLVQILQALLSLAARTLLIQARQSLRVQRLAQLLGLLKAERRGRSSENKMTTVSTSRKANVKRLMKAQKMAVNPHCPRPQSSRGSSTSSKRKRANASRKSSRRSSSKRSATASKLWVPSKKQESNQEASASAANTIRLACTMTRCFPTSGYSSNKSSETNQRPRF